MGRRDHTNLDVYCRYHHAAPFLSALVGGAYLLYQAITGSESDSDQALEELRLAYARGELTDEEYEQRREALERDT